MGALKQLTMAAVSTSVLFALDENSLAVRPRIVYTISHHILDIYIQIMSYVNYYEQESLTCVAWKTCSVPVE